MVNAIRLVLFATFLAFVATPLAAGDPPLTVVELFTSQGCSSCPPADALIGELAERDDILALSHHVDYWDYLGWRDTLAKPANTERQRAYARDIGLRYVYTPQIVIHGAYQVTGSRRQEVLDRIARARPDNPVPVTITRDGDNEMVVSIGAAPAAEDAIVWLAMFDREHVTAVGAGENRGRVLRTFNVVRSFSRVGSWHGEPTATTLPTPPPAEAGDGCAVLVQARDSGRILGAARLMLDED